MQAFGYAHPFGSQSAVAIRCLSIPRRLDPKLGSHAGAWIPNPDYTPVFGAQRGDPASCHVANSSTSTFLNLGGLPKSEGHRPGDIGAAVPVALFFGRGVTAAGVTGSGLAERSEGSGQ